MPDIRTTDGVKIAYDAWGKRDGTPVLMIQGLGMDSRGWALQRGAFGRKHRCIALDNRGTGRLRRAARPVRPGADGRGRDRGARRRRHRTRARRRRVDGWRHRADHRRAAPRARARRSRSPAPRAATTTGAASCSRSGPRSSASAACARWRRTTACAGSIGPRLQRRFGVLDQRARPRADADEARAVRRAGRRDPRRAATSCAPSCPRSPSPTLVITGSQDTLTPARRRRGARRADPDVAALRAARRRARPHGRGAERLQRRRAALPRRGRRNAARRRGSRSRARNRVARARVRRRVRAEPGDARATRRCGRRGARRSTGRATRLRRRRRTRRARIVQSDNTTVTVDRERVHVERHRRRPCERCSSSRRYASTPATTRPPGSVSAMSSCQHSR